MIRSTSVLRYAAIGMATLALGGFAAASTASITGPTGPQSHNTASATLTATNHVNNNNNVGLGNVNEQVAGSGSASASDNTTAGDAASGGAINGNDTNTTVMVSNGAGADPSMDVDLGGGSADLTGPTGPQSQNEVKTDDSYSNTVDNNNNVDVLNENVQEAVSGNASAKDNTTAGDVTSGDASNTNSTTTGVSISN